MESRNAGRVAIGVGAIHNPPRAAYSEETRNLITVLMEESKLTMMQRKSIQEAVDKGEALPHPHLNDKKKCTQKFAEAQVMFPSAWRKRSQDTIAMSGAYERDQFRRTAPLLNKEKQKRHLACMMAYGQDMPPTPHGPKILHRSMKKHQLPEDFDPYAEVVKTIEERLQFMNEIEGLGQGKKYRPIIQQEVAQKLTLLKKMDNQKSVGLEKMMDQFRLDRSTPKPFPMAELDC